MHRCGLAVLHSVLIEVLKRDGNLTQGGRQCILRTAIPLAGDWEGDVRARYMYDRLTIITISTIKVRIGTI